MFKNWKLADLSMASSEKIAIKLNFRITRTQMFSEFINLNKLVWLIGNLFLKNYCKSIKSILINQTSYQTFSSVSNQSNVSPYGLYIGVLPWPSLSFKFITGVLSTAQNSYICFGLSFTFSSPQLRLGF